MGVRSSSSVAQSLEIAERDRQSVLPACKNEARDIQGGLSSKEGGAEPL